MNDVYEGDFYFVLHRPSYIANTALLRLTLCSALEVVKNKWTTPYVYEMNSVGW